MIYRKGNFLSRMGVLLAVVGFCSTALADHSYCDLYFSDNNRNGLGSVEGYCQLSIEYDTHRYGDSPSLQIVVSGRGHNERRSVFHDSRLRVTEYSTLNSYPHFWDGNRNGNGTVEGTIHFQGIEHWRSRNISVFAYIDGRRHVIFSGRIARH